MATDNNITSEEYAEIEEACSFGPMVTRAEVMAAEKEVQPHRDIRRRITTLVLTKTSEELREASEKLYSDGPEVFQDMWEQITQCLKDSIAMKELASAACFRTLISAAGCVDDERFQAMKLELEEAEQFSIFSE